MGELSKLPGLGSKSETMLNQVGIFTEADLRSVGVMPAFLRLQNYPDITPSLNFLYALVGALEGRRWSEVAQTDRQRLLFELQDYQELLSILATDDS